MQHKFVRVHIDIDCMWDLENPSYRVYVNKELFTERTWIWRNDYLEEMLQVSAPPGQYLIEVKLVEPAAASLMVSNMRVKQGDAQIINNNVLEILP